MQIERIETDRLKGERICNDHGKLLLEMASNLEVMATLGGTLFRFTWNLPTEIWLRPGLLVTH